MVSNAELPHSQNNNQIWECLPTTSNYVDQIAFSPDGKIFASLIWLDHFPLEETIKLWEVETGTELYSIPVQGVTADNKYGAVLAFSSDSRILASNCGDSFPRLGNGRILKEETELLRSTILLIDVVTGQQLCKFEGLNNYPRDRWGFCHFLRKKVVSLAFSPDDQFLASGDSTGTITLWQLKKGSFQPLTSEKIRTFSHVSKQPIKTLAFSPDGQTLATGHGDNNGGITLWDIKNGKKLETFAGHIVSASKMCWTGFMDRDEVAVSPDGKAIASSGYNDIIKLWDTQTGSFLRSLESKSHPGSAEKITFSQDGKFLVSVNKPDIVLWEVSTGREIQSIKPDPDADNFYSLSWGSRYLNQYGDLLAIAGTANITLWQVSSGEKLDTINRYHRGWGRCLTFSPNGQTLAFTEKTGLYTIKLWDIKTSSEISILEQTFKSITSLNFSGNGEVLVSSYSDGTIAVWQQKRGLA
jgi:WD40 repeat protein